MTTHEATLSRSFLVLALCVATVGAMAQEDSPPSPTALEASQWLDASGNPLPFQDDAAVREALRTATLVSRERSSRPGLEGYDMLQLEADGARFHALYLGSEATAKLEIAASLVDRMLGFHLVPPVAGRTIGDETAAVQIWRQRAGTEVEVEQADQMRPPDPRGFAQQRQAVYLFDSLIANPGRSRENTLIDPGWRIWLIDHDSAFQPTTELLFELELTKCDRTQWHRLRDLDTDALELLVAPYLDKKQVSTLVARHRKLVRHIQRMITTFGEDVVLFDTAR